MSGSNPINKQFFFFDQHDSHMADNALDDIVNHNTEPFFLIADTSTLDQPNDNKSRLALKRYYNEVNDE